MELMLSDDPRNLLEKNSNIFLFEKNHLRFFIRELSLTNIDPKQLPNLLVF